MYYVAHDGQIYDDGRGDWTNAYAVGPGGQRLGLSPDVASRLTQRYYADHPPPAIGGLPAEKIAEIRSRFPIGDVIASLTTAAGIQPCAPCKRRQAALNAMGDRVAGVFGGGRG